MLCQVVYHAVLCLHTLLLFRLCQLFTCIVFSDTSSLVYVFVSGSVQFQLPVVSDSLQTSGTTACQASLFFTNSQSLLKLTSSDPVMPSSHLILCHPLLLLPSIFPRLMVFSSESVLCISWPKYWSFQP